MDHLITYGIPPKCFHNRFCVINKSRRFDLLYFACAFPNNMQCKYSKWLWDDQIVHNSSNNSSNPSKLSGEVLVCQDNSRIRFDCQDTVDTVSFQSNNLNTNDNIDYTALSFSKGEENSLDHLIREMNNMSFFNPKTKERISNGLDFISEDVVKEIKLSLQKKIQVLKNSSLCLDKVSKDFKSSLFEYQKQGVEWMIGREIDISENMPSGGILGDSMGLGKTLQMIALILYTFKQASYGISYGNRSATMIICPKSLVDQWEDEFTKHLGIGVLKILKYHGSKRKKYLNDFSNFDVVISTYQTISSDLKLQDSPIRKHQWLRLVLDEGHIIKNSGSKTHKSLCEIDSKFRWVLTATPFQNSVDDLFSFFHFLRFLPFGEETWWNMRMNPSSKCFKHISNQKKDEILQLSLQSVMLRRTKEQKDLISGEPLVTLPGKKIFLHKLPFEFPYEKDKYNNFQQKLRAWFQENKSANCILPGLLRLRQCCDHVDLIESVLSESLKDKQGDLLCTICSEILFDGVPSVRTSCGHVFCSECFSSRSLDDSVCPMCRSEFEIIESKQGYLNKTPVSRLSTKLRFLIDELSRIKRENPGDKIVVFSQWTSMLDIVERFLCDQRIAGVARLDGTLNSTRRLSEITRFKTDADVSVFLISLKCGGVGLNLVEANHVYILDLWWNPTVEEQAFDRVYRIGQTKPVFIHRIVMKDSIEERMLLLQQKKSLLADRVLKGEDAREVKNSVSGWSMTRAFKLSDEDILTLLGER